MRYEIYTTTAKKNKKKVNWIGRLQTQSFGTCVADSSLKVHSCELYNNKITNIWSL